MEPVGQLLGRIPLLQSTTATKEAAAYRRLTSLSLNYPAQPTAWQVLEFELAEAAWIMRLSELGEARRDARQ